MTVKIRRNTTAFAINRYAEGKVTQMLRLEKEVMKEIFWELLIRTPVDKGWLIGSWYASKSKRGANRPGVRDPSGLASMRRFEAFLETYEFGTDLIVYNTMKYARFVEWGTSKMPPAAMMRETLRIAPNIAQRVINRYKRWNKG